MSVRFAGSVELGQRRRRRLALEATGTASPPGVQHSSRPHSDSGSAPSQPVSTGTFSGTRLPARTIVPGSWIVVGAIISFAVICWATVLWLSQSAIADQLGIGEMVSLEKGVIPRFFSTIALLATAQLHLLIYWHRSKSRKDFLGRYRIWGWAGFFWCAVCFANTTQAHIPLLESISSRFAINCWRGEELIWFIPLSVGVLSLYWLVGRDVNPSRLSSAVWNTTFFIGIGVGLLYLGLDLLFPIEWRTDIRAGAAMLWQLALASFCLIHARYVTHVTNEAGPKRQTTRSKIGRKMTARCRQVGESVLSVKLPVRKCPAAVKNAPAKQPEKNTKKADAPSTKVSLTEKLSIGSKGLSAKKLFSSLRTAIVGGMLSGLRRQKQADGAVDKTPVEKKVKLEKKPVEKTVDKTVEKPTRREQPAAEAGGEETGKTRVGLGTRLRAGSAAFSRVRESVLGRMSRRIDPPQPVEQIASQTHLEVKKRPDAPAQAESKPVTKPVLKPAEVVESSVKSNEKTTKVLERPVVPVAVSTPVQAASDPSSAPLSAKLSKKEKKAARQNEQYESGDDYDGEDDDYGEMSSRDRKKLKKAQRRQGYSTEE